MVKRIETTLEHRLLAPGNPAVTLHPAILMLHGRGSDEDDLLSLAQFLDRHQIERIRSNRLKPGIVLYALNC